MWIFGPIPMFACSLLMVVILHMLDTNSLPLHQHQFTVRDGMSSREVSHLLQLLQGTPVLRIQFSATPSCHLWHFSVDGDNVCYKTWMQVWIYSTWILRYKIFITNTVSLGKMLHIELWIKDWDHDTSVKYSLKVSWSDTNLSQSYSRIYHIHTPLSEWKTSREMVHTGSDVL